MIHSNELNELAAALSKAQGEIIGAIRDSTNPHFKSKYADLSSVWEAIRGPFAKHGLSVVQGLQSSESGVSCETRILHASGQWVASVFTIPADKQNAHGYGSAATYCRRFGLQALAGIAPIDDDGNAATQAAPMPDRTLVMKVAAAINEHLANDRDMGALQEWEQVRDNHELASMVWSQIPSKNRETLRALATASAKGSV